MTPAARTPAYAPRNALNAEALKRAIEARSLARGDDPAIRTWLLNHFCRHVIANFEPADSIASIEAAREHWGRAPLPAWATLRLEAGAKQGTTQGAKQGVTPVPVVWVDPQEPGLLATEARLVEFLGSRAGTALAGKLDRINCPQALALWDREHAEMRTRIESGWRVSQPAALRTLLSTPNGTFTELLHDSPLLRAEMAFESYAMRHCLGQFADRGALTGGYGERYAAAVEQGDMRLLSFRDAGGQPHITISLLVRPDGVPIVEQVKGKQNRPPIDRYVDDVRACLDSLNTDPSTPDDCIAIGLVRTQAGWQRLEQVSEGAAQAQLVARHPVLFARLAAPTPMVEWLVAARQPALLRTRTPRAAAVAYAVRSTTATPATPTNTAATVRFATEGVPWPGLQEVR